MKLSVIIPVYNEESTIEEVIDKVRAVEVPIDKEIIVVDDGSTDHTAEILEHRQQDVTFVHFSRINLGKGAAGQAMQSFNVMFGLEETMGLV